ncbi:hypothetical protein BEP19_03840 [Ammoniphilus oxalaticus]|uniref:Uncharacterized protein n=1 Tax=Ammoniphilus oxalaticus TaxID=66863 RepID=A0A419SLP0_9BACL|nr:CBO0543 family protein [Ammoniphilus oxalaticus]RKD24978.1 hypothetical protein BEP19_03840 [Ammoniphilus oxalaticus]
MIFFLGLFILSWIWFLLFADKSKFRLFYPSVLLAMYLACAVDFFAHHYELWNYPAPTNQQTFWYHLMQQFGIYPITVYFFLQWLPRRQTWNMIAVYIFAWSMFAFMIEWLAITYGFMEHLSWWNLRCSYLADWILFIIFYRHHQWRANPPR